MSHKSTTKEFQEDLETALLHLKDNEHFQVYLASVSAFKNKYFDEATNIRINLLDQAKCLGAAGALDEVLRVANYNMGER